MKSYMDMEKVPVIPHMIKELPDWKAFVGDHIPNDNNKLIGHTRPNSSKSMSEMMDGMLCSTKCSTRTRSGCPKMVY